MIFVINLIDSAQIQYMLHQFQQTDHDKSFFKSILDTAIDGIIIIDTKGLIVLANESACNLFGYDEIDLIHQKINMLMPEHDKSVHDHYLLNHVGPHPKKIMGKGREINGLTKQGMTIPLRIAVSKFIIHEETFFTGVIHDLTEQKQIEEKLQVLNKSLENLVNSRTKQLQDSINQLSNANNILEIEIGQRKIVENKLKENEINLINALEKERDINQLKSRFVSIASHEFRTPLANILSSINLIDKYEDLETLEKRKKHIGKIKNNPPSSGKDRVAEHGMRATGIGAGREQVGCDGEMCLIQGVVESGVLVVVHRRIHARSEKRLHRVAITNPCCF